MNIIISFKPRDKCHCLPLMKNEESRREGNKKKEGGGGKKKKGAVGCGSQYPTPNSTNHPSSQSQPKPVA